MAVAGVPHERYERRVRWHVWLVVCALAAASWGGCESFPPVLTGITIAPSNADGQAQGDLMSRTRQAPPIPLIVLRSGSNPGDAGPVLNQADGDVAVTLARGVQSFLLFTTPQESSPYFVLAVFLDGESTPALSAVVSGDASRPVVASRAPTLMGLEGEPVPNHSSLSIRRKGYRIWLRSAAFSLPVKSFDVAGLWRLGPDGISDAVGVITIEVQSTAREQQH
jgi:hypothetical protein